MRQDVLERAVRLLREKGKRPKRRDAQPALRCANGDIRHYLDAAERIVAGKAQLSDYVAPEPDWTFHNGNRVNYEEQSDSATVESPKGRITTLEQLLEAAQVDLETWEVERWVANKWEVGAKDAANRLQVEPLFQVKAWLKRKVKPFDEVRLEALKAAVIDAAAANALPPSKPRYRASRDAYMLEPCLFDVHVGKLAWAEESGESYDLKLAQSAYESVFDDLLERVSGFHFDKIIFPIGNDGLHVDTAANTTTAGTPQDVDSRWQKAFRVYLRLMRRAIERLAELAPVDVPVIPGNHARVLEAVAGEALAELYANHKHITIDASAYPRKYRRYGRNLIGFTHGDGEKASDLPLKMATEAPELWAATIYREFHTGHKHQRNKTTTRFQDLSEHSGVAVRIIEAICASDAWHTAKGYTGNLRAGEAYVWHRDEGLVAQFSSVVKPPQILAEAA